MYGSHFGKGARAFKIIFYHKCARTRCVAFGFTVFVYFFVRCNNAAKLLPRGQPEIKLSVKVSFGVGNFITYFVSVIVKKLFYTSEGRNAAVSVFKRHVRAVNLVCSVSG